MKNNKKSTPAKILHQVIEKSIKPKLNSFEKFLSSEELLSLNQDIEFIQNEYENQKTALAVAKNKAQAISEKYNNLYNLSTSALFTLSNTAELLKLNLKTAELLDKESSLLINRRFTDFVSVDTRIIFNKFLENVFDKKLKGNCELIVSTDSNIATHVHLSGVMDEVEDQCNITMIDITKRKIAELKLLQSDLLLKTTIDSQKDTIIFSIDINYNYLTFNKTHADVMKRFYNTDIEKGMNILKCISIDEDRNNAKKNYDRALQGESHSNIKIYGDKEKAFYESFFNPIIDTNNNIIGASGLARDITKRIQAEEKIRKSEEKYRTLFDSNKDSITLFRIEPDGKIGNFIETNPATSELFGFTKKELLALNISDLEQTRDKNRSKRKKDLMTKGRMCFETIIKNKKGNHRNVEIEAILINYENKTSVMNITRDITERKQLENNIKKSNENLISILEAIPELLFEVGLDGKIYHYQSHRDDLLAAPPSEFMGKCFQDILPADVSAICFKAIQEANEKGWSTGHQYSLDLPKGKFWFELSVSPISGNINKDKHFILLATNITDRKQAESKFRDEQNRINTILEMVGDPIFVKNNEHIITYANSHFCKLFNLDEKSVIGKTLAENVPRKERKHFTKIDRSVLDTGITDLREEEITMIGLTRTIITRKTRFIDELGNKFLVGSIHDITERKKAELKLIANEIFLNQTQNIAKIGSYSLDFKTGKWTSSPVLDSIFGINQNFDRSIEGWISLIHPEWRNIMHNHIYNDVIINRFSFNKEYKIIKADTKKEHWVHGMGEITLDKDGEPNHLIGSIQDITERKKAEEKLRISSERFQDLVDSTGGIVWEADAKTIIFNYVSQEAERLLGYPVEDWYKKGFWENHLHPEDKDETLIFCATQTKKMQAHDFKYRFRAKSGKYVWLRDIVTVVVEDGKPKQLRGVMFDITEQIETNQLLSESEEKYRGLVEGSPDGIVLYSDNKIVYINDEGLRIMKTTNRSDLIGKAVLQFIHPDSLKDVIKRMKEVTISKIVPASFEVKFIDFLGNTVYVEAKAIPTVYENKHAIQVIAHDITERKKAQEKIRQLSQAVEQSPVSIVITNTKGEIEYANPKFSETTGYSLDEVTGQNPRFLKSGHTSVEEYEQLYQTLEQGKEWHGEFHNKKKDGELYWESASISPIINAQGRTTHFIAIKENITDRKNAEQELIQAKLRAEESDRLKLAFLANMSHEIRTPMNGILGFTELLKTPKLTGEEQQGYIEIIEKSGIRMLNIINDIISISKVESGQIEVTLSETNINDQIEYLNTFFKPETKQKGIQLLVTKKLSEEDSYTLTDREKIYAVLTNLVKNAIKFTNEGTIEFGCIKKKNTLEFFVKDTGLGISKSQQKLIFERFRQANESLTRNHEGSGLGLAISKAYIEMLGGTIWVESEERKGSTFYFTIPYDKNYKAEEEVNISKETDLTPNEEEKISNLKVLIVEDDSISKLLITIAVKPFSKEIIKVSTGSEAIEACRNNPDIDLVMMDINMPEMGGYEATEQIREFNKDLVIIAQTANGMQGDHDNAIAAGCTDYISKPINIDKLSELIQKYFRK